MKRHGKKAAGRYDKAGVAPLSSGMGAPPAGSAVQTATVAIDDPMEAHRAWDDPRKRRILATVNRNVDVLESERSRGRITEDAYRIGRIIQLIFERSAGVQHGAGSSAGVRADPATARELKLIAALDNARAAGVMLDQMRAFIGHIDAHIVRQIIADGWTYSQVATSRGLPGERGERYCARRFRDALEALAKDMPWPGSS